MAIKWTHFAAASCCALSASAYAQSSVTLYGILDTGVEYVSHANAAGDHVVRMPGITGEIPSRWGLRGAEDLGGGYKAVFALESGFNPRGGDSGQGGRAVWTSGLGGYIEPLRPTVALGRQYTMTYWAMADARTFSARTSTAAVRLIHTCRMPEAITPSATRAPSMKKLTVGATYSFGRDGAGTGSSSHRAKARAHGCRCLVNRPTAVNGPPCSSTTPRCLALRPPTDEQRGGAAAAANFFDGVAPFPLTSGADKDLRMQLNGWANIFGVKIGGGWVGRHVDTETPATPNVHSNLFYLGAAYAITPAFTLDGEVYRITNAQQDARATMGTLRGTYSLSKATAVYLQGSYLSNSSQGRYSLSSGGGGTTPPAGANQTGLMAGIRHAF